MKYALSEPQVGLLREVAAASTAMPVPSSRTQAAWALEKRGLIKRTWRGSGHVAVATADGRYYLAHGKHPRQVQAERERLERDAVQAARAPADGAELISRLQSASGKITVPDPAAQTRGRWRAAYYDALHHGHVQAGHKLRWNGRQRGDCVFRLVDEEAEKAAQPPPVPAVDVPETLDRPHRLVRATRGALGRSQSAVDTQTDLKRGEAEHTLAIVIRGRAFPLVLTERTSKIPHEPTPQELPRQQRSPWTRLPKYDQKFNGRLTLGAPAGTWYQHSYSYSDGARWTLESRLGHLLQDLERLAAEAERREREKEYREAEQRRRWYAAVPLAREQQIEQHRATVLTGQVRGWRQAAEIRAFCQAARARVGDAPVATDEADWLRWAESYAEQLDPLQDSLRTPPNPPAGREVLRELANVDDYAYPWPFDAEGHWTRGHDDPADPHT